jgi:hypothetical protein
MSNNLRQIADILIRSVSGGDDVADGKYSPQYVEALIPALRQQAIIDDYYGTRTRAASRRLDYALYQTADITVNNVPNNPNDYITFTCPKCIGVGRLIDGLEYVGQQENSIGFKRLLNRGDISNNKARNMFDGSVIAYIWASPNLEVYGNNALTELQVRGIFSDPTEVPNFDIENDPYPISENILLLMTDLFKMNQNINIQTPADITLDGKLTNPR